MSKPIRFEITYKDGRYLWKLANSNRKTIALGRPDGYGSVKGAMEAIERLKMVIRGNVPWRTATDEVWVHPDVPSDHERTMAKKRRDKVGRRMQKLRHVWLDPDLPMAKRQHAEVLAGRCYSRYMDIPYKCVLTKGMNILPNDRHVKTMLSNFGQAHPVTLTEER